MSIAKTIQKQEFVALKDYLVILRIDHMYNLTLRHRKKPYSKKQHACCSPQYTQVAWCMMSLKRAEAWLLVGYGWLSDYREGDNQYPVNCQWHLPGVYAYLNTTLLCVMGYQKWEVKVNQLPSARAFYSTSPVMRVRHESLRRGGGLHTGFHIQTHTQALVGNQEPVLHRQGPTLPCARWSHLPLLWQHQPEGKALLCVRACVRVCMYASVCVCEGVNARQWLWQKLELKEERVEIGGRPAGIHLCPACLRFMPDSFMTLYQGRYWAGGFNYQRLYWWNIKLLFYRMNDEKMADFPIITVSYSETKITWKHSGFHACSDGEMNEGTSCTHMYKSCMLVWGKTGKINSLYHQLVVLNSISDEELTQTIRVICLSMGGGGLGLHCSLECPEFITTSTQMVSGCFVSSSSSRPGDTHTHKHRAGHGPAQTGRRSWLSHCPLSSSCLPKPH